MNTGSKLMTNGDTFLSEEMWRNDFFVMQVIQCHAKNVLMKDYPQMCFLLPFIIVMNALAAPVTVAFPPLLYSALRIVSLLLL